MTYREKLIKEYPDCVNEQYGGGCQGCPYDYNYGPEGFGTDKCLRFTPATKSLDLNALCTQCWDKKIFDKTFNSLLNE